VALVQQELVKRRCIEERSKNRGSNTAPWSPGIISLPSTFCPRAARINCAHLHASIPAFSARNAQVCIPTRASRSHSSTLCNFTIRRPGPSLPRAPGIGSERPCAVRSVKCEVAGQRSTSSRYGALRTGTCTARSMRRASAAAGASWYGR
jgi:hypothetical protein